MSQAQMFQTQQTQPMSPRNPSTTQTHGRRTRECAIQQCLRVQVPARGTERVTGRLGCETSSKHDVNNTAAKHIETERARTHTHAHIHTHVPVSSRRSLSVAALWLSPMARSAASH